MTVEENWDLFDFVRNVKVRYKRILGLEDYLWERSSFMSPIWAKMLRWFLYHSDGEIFCIYMYHVFSSVKSELIGFIFPRLNLCNLSLLPEDYNGNQRQGFQSLQTKAIQVNFYINCLFCYQRTDSETRLVYLDISGFFIICSSHGIK